MPNFGDQPRKLIKCSPYQCKRPPRTSCPSIHNFLRKPVNRRNDAEMTEIQRQYHCLSASRR